MGGGPQRGLWRALRGCAPWAAGGEREGLTTRRASCIKKVGSDTPDRCVFPAVRKRSRSVINSRTPSGKVLLASGSPRRVHLLRSLIDTFSELPCDVDEQLLPGEPPSAYALRMAETKARTACQRLRGEDETEWIIGADTIVVLNGEVYGKPSDRQDAKRILQSLQGKVHQVLTGICLLHRGSGRAWKDLVSTQVRMMPLTDSEMEGYIQSGEPFGKAGAYAIQGLGGRLVEGTEGSFTNVVGLPIERLRYWMEALGILASEPHQGGLPSPGS